MLCRSAVFTLFVSFAAAGSSLHAQIPDSAQIVASADRAIATATLATPAPGCAVGVAHEGRSIYQKAFGLAEMEFGIPNTPETVFESGSVAKQFVAASIVLLAIDGKVGLDEPARRYIPELPDYGTPLTVRHLLNHTGGVRDWGSVLALTGVGRGDRVVSQELALDVIVHQRALDFTPAAEYSYSNSGYTLLTEIVERVSGQSLTEFTEARFFKPLGMTHSSWRINYKTLVPGRAQAYARQGTGPWRLEMPFMNVYGNGGMLTTVGDWLRWNAMLDARSLGGALVDSLETRGTLQDGSRIPYALGLVVDSYRGQRQIGHGGSTAGYSTYLARYPAWKLSVAVLCNGAGLSVGPTAIAHGIVDGLLPPRPTTPTVAVTPPAPAAPAARWNPTSAELATFTGVWHSDEADATFTVVVDSGSLFLVQRPTRRGRLRPQTPDHFARGPGAELPVWFTRDAAGTVTTMHMGMPRLRDMPFRRTAVPAVETASPTAPLYEAIARMDDSMSLAFNAHDVPALMALFAPDLEFYHDAGGLQSYAMVHGGFTNLLGRNDGMRRQLVAGTLEVYPVKGFGAIETGSHRFCHQENGRDDCGTFKFVQIWRLAQNQWQIARVVSYGH